MEDKKGIFRDFFPLESKMLKRIGQAVQVRTRDRLSRYIERNLLGFDAGERRELKRPSGGQPGKVSVVMSERLPVPPVRGGAVETWTWQVFRRLSRQFPTTIYSIFDDRLPRRHCEEGIIFQHVDPHRMPFRWLPSVLGCYWESPLHAFPYVLQVAQSLCRRRISLVHVQNRPQFVPLLRRAAPSAKIILHLQNQYLTQDRPSAKVAQAAARLVDGVICASRFIEQDVLRAYPELQGKTAVVYNGADVAQFTQLREEGEPRRAVRHQYGLEGKKVVFFAGRLVPEKGILELLQAIPEVFAQHPDSILMVAGAAWFGEDIENEFVVQLRQVAEPYRERIVFTGYRPPEEMPLLYVAADLFVAPSYWDDPSPLVLYEAAAAGLPVVSTQRGGIPEIVQDGVTGVLVDDPADTDQLADVIATLLADEDQRREMGKRARQLAEERFSWEYVAARTAEVYQGLLA